MRPFLLFIDTETSGLPKKWDLPYSVEGNWPHAVQFSWTVYTVEGRLIKQENHYIGDPDFTVTPESIQVHGITREFLDRNGEPRRKVMELLTADLIAFDPVVIGHFIELDLHLAGAEYYRSGMENIIQQYPSYCTMQATRHLVRPDVYLRIRPGHKKTVLLKLENAGIAFRLIAPATIAVGATAPLDQVLELNREAVIQDASSQMVGELMEEMKTLLPEKGLKVWDCCAASGGKSILVKDVVGKMELTVSDVRESVLHNLRSRMKEAGIGGYKALVADLANPSTFIPLEKQSFDLIIADVPCSGSGTWARTPEQLATFQEADLGKYTTLQEKIVSRVLPYLKKRGTLLYITCSVFREENEDRVTFLQQEKGLKLVKATYLEGYAQKADTLYAAFFTAL